VTDGDALLRAILADPRNDLLRLVYADWLEETGQYDRARFIRVQIELARIFSKKMQIVENELLGPIGDRVWQRRREWALPIPVRELWPTAVGGWEWRRGFPEVWHCPLALWETFGSLLVLTNPIRRVLVIDREPRVSWSNPRKPDRTWFRDDADWVQRPDEGCLIPPDLFELLEPDSFDLAMFDHAQTYPTRADAVSALSNACLSWAATPSLRPS